MPVVADVWVEQSVSSVTLCVCLCVSAHCKRKTTLAINSKLGTHALYGLRSKGQGHVVMKCVAGLVCMSI